MSITKTIANRWNNRAIFPNDDWRPVKFTGRGDAVFSGKQLFQDGFPHIQFNVHCFHRIIGKVSATNSNNFFSSCLQSESSVKDCPALWVPFDIADASHETYLFVKTVLVGRVGFEPTVFPMCLIYSQVPSPTRHTDPYRRRRATDFYCPGGTESPPPRWVSTTIFCSPPWRSREDSTAQKAGIPGNTLRMFSGGRSGTRTHRPCLRPSVFGTDWLPLPHPAVWRRGRDSNPQTPSAGVRQISNLLPCHWAHPFI